MILVFNKTRNCTHTEIMWKGVEQYDKTFLCLTKGIKPMCKTCKNELLLYSTFTKYLLSNLL